MNGGGGPPTELCLPDDPPIPSTPPLISGSGYVGNTLSTNNGGWCGGVSSWSYEWLRSGSPIASGSANTYVVATADVGHAMRSRVTACNANGCSVGPQSSNAITIQNRAPNAPSNLSPADGTVSANLAPTLSATFSDPDGQSGYVAFAINRVRDGVNVAFGNGTAVGSGGTSSWTVPAGALDYSEVDGYDWVATFASDGSLTTGPSGPNRYFPRNAAPNTPTDLIPPDGTIAPTTTPTLYATFSDPDGHTGHVEFEIWRQGFGLVATGVGTTVVSGQTSSWTVPANTLDFGADYYWYATAVDAYNVESAASAGPADFFPNRAPGAPTLTSPADAAAVPSVTPVLSASGTDPDADPIEYAFEVATESDFDPPSVIVAASGWMPATSSWTVPPGALRDGQRYYWRARLRDRLAQVSVWSAVRFFDVRVPKLGLRDYWPIWSRGPLAVNQATGNLVITLPGPSYPLGTNTMSASLTYNSLASASANEGLGPRWTLETGEEGAPPAKLIDHNLLSGADRYDAVERVSGDGSSDFYTHVAGSNTYLSAPGEGSQLSKNANGSWILLDADGAVYTFGSAATNGSYPLASAEWVDADRSQTPLYYCFDGARLTSIRDASCQTPSPGRELRFIWGGGIACPDAILCITGPDNVTWKYVGDGPGGTSGRLVRINNGIRDVVAIRYDATSGLPDRLQNANDLNPGAASPGYNGAHALTISYHPGTNRVATVGDGPVTNQTPATSTWSFAYATSGPYTTPRTARSAEGYTTLTPPRQQGLPSPATSKVYYDNLGRTMESVDLLGDITAVSYDERDQPVWSEDELGQRTDHGYAGPDGQATSNRWVATALASTTGPDPDGAGPLARPVSRHRYDESRMGDDSLTVSGNEITDVTRAAALSGDGLSAPDSSFGIWEGTTNLIANGGLETNVSGWSGFQATLSRITSRAKFGTASLRAAVSGSATAYSADAASSLSGATAGRTFTATFWVFAEGAAVGKTLSALLREEGGASGSQETTVSRTLTAGWQRVAVTRTLAQNDRSTLRLLASRPSGATAGEYVDLDGAQLEEKAFSTPYVETNGAIATRQAARLQAPAGTITKTQGWVALRIRAGVASSPSTNMRLFSFGDNTNDELFVWVSGNGSFQTGREVGGAGAQAQQVRSFAAGEQLTVIGAWTAAQVKVSVNGASFTTAANANNPTIATTLFDLGQRGYTAQNWLDGDILWAAAGTGTLTDADAGALHAFGSETPGTWSYPPAAQATAAWSAVTAAYRRSVPAAGPPLKGLQAAYYANPDLADRPAALQNDGNVDFLWGAGGPAAVGGATDNFSVRWSGYLSVPSEGDYTFATVADDGTRLTIDGTLAVDNWRDGAGRFASQAIHLTPGLHKLVLEYYDRSGNAEVELRWACPACSPSRAEEVIASSFLYPGWFNRTSSVSPAGRTSFSHFPNPANARADYTLTRLLEGSNLITSFAYDAYGRVTEKVMPKGNANRTIDAAGTLQGSADPTYATTYTYYGAGEAAAPPGACGGGAVNQSQLLKTTTPRGVATTTFVYDTAGRQVAKTNGAGTTCSTYDNEGRLTSTVAPGDAQATSYSYDPAGARRTATDASGSVTSEYDEQGRLKRSVDSFGAEATFAYDAEGNTLSRVAAKGALGSNSNYTTGYTYDAEGKLSTVTDPAARPYSFFYDPRGNLKATQYPNGTFSWNDYNQAGWLTAVYNRHGTVQAPLPATAPADNQASPLADFAYEYELDGKKTSEERRSGSTLTAAGSAVTDVTRAAGAQGDGRAAPDSSFGVWEGTTNLLPNGGLETSIASWGWWRASLALDSTRKKFGQRSVKVTAASAGFGFAASAPHSLSGATAGRTFSGSLWIYAEGAIVGRQFELLMRENGGASASQESSSGPVTLAAGWQRVTATRTIAQNDRTAIELHAFVSATVGAGEYFYADGAQIEEKGFATPYVQTDGAAAARAAARLQAPASTITKTQGWVALRIRPGVASSAGRHMRLFTFGDNANDELFVEGSNNGTFSVGREVGGSGAQAQQVRSFGAGEQLTVIGAWTASEVKISVNGAPFTAAANASNPTIATTLFDLGQRGYSAENWLDGDLLWAAAGTGTLGNADATALHAFADRDPELGELPGVAKLAWAGDAVGPEQQRFRYDELGRLEGVTLPLGTERRYFFDRDSNRTRITENGLETAGYVYDPANPSSDGVDQLSSVTESGQTRTLVHDADGRVTSRGADTLTWDGWDRLTGGTFSSTTVSYGFDPLGVRRQRVAGGITTRYLQGGLFETDGAGTITNSDVDGAAGDLAHFAGPPTTSSTVTYLYYNGHGDLAAQADGAGARTGAFTYDPFGAPKQAQPANKTVERWTGRWDKKLDTASSLIEMGARPYDPALGRFLAVDPVDGGSANAYDYAYQDPLNAYDLDGRLPWDPSRACFPCGVSPGRGAANGNARATPRNPNKKQKKAETRKAVGKPIRIVNHSTRKEAEQAARGEGQGRPVNHPPHGPGQRPHFHPTNERGKPIPRATHHAYPRRRF